MTYFEEQIIEIRNSTYGKNCKDYLFLHAMQARRFIDTYYADEINIEQMAGVACFSKFHFIRLFKSIYGQTPHQYLTSVRIDRAKDLLPLVRTIEEACYLVGFESPGSFKALFKRYTQQTPSVYKNWRQKRQMVRRGSAPCLPQYFR